jgi:hypothetical protein
VSQIMQPDRGQVARVRVGPERRIGEQPVPGVRIDYAVSCNALLVALEGKHYPPRVLVALAGGSTPRACCASITAWPVLPILSWLACRTSFEMAADVIRMNRLASFDGEDVTGVGPRRTPLAALGRLPGLVLAKHRYGSGVERENARIEHDKALNRVMTAVLKDDTELFKQFSDNDSFKRWLSDSIFAVTYEESGKRSA